MTEAASATPDLFAPLEPSVLTDPYPAYRRLRESAPVYWHEQLESWVLTRHADCLRVLRDPSAFVSDWRKLGMEIPAPADSIQTLDPPDHTAIRGVFGDALRELDWPALEAEVHRDAQSLLRALAARPDCDLVPDFAVPIAQRAVSALMGVDIPDPERFREWSDAIVLSMDSGFHPETEETGMRARAEMTELCASWLERPPAGGLVGRVVRHPGVSAIPPEVVLNTVRVVLQAGYGTGMKLVTNFVLTLARHPEAVGRIRREPELLESAFHELVRYDGPTQAESRMAAADCTLDGVVVERGDVVVLLLAAANRDPEEFDSPDTLRLDRHPNRHLGFGWGIHYCLGLPLGAAIGQSTISALALEDVDVGLAGDPVHSPTATLRGLTSLPARVRSGHRGAPRRNSKPR